MFKFAFSWFEIFWKKEKHLQDIIHGDTNDLNQKLQ